MRTRQLVADVLELTSRYHQLQAQIKAPVDPPELAPVFKTDDPSLRINAMQVELQEIENRLGDILLQWVDTLRADFSRGTPYR